METSAVQKYEQLTAALTLIGTLGNVTPDVSVGTVIFKAIRKLQVLELTLVVVGRNFEAVER